MLQLKYTFYLLLLTSLFLSCDKDKRGSSDEENVAKLPYSMLPPTKELPKLSDKYVKQKNTEIANFFTENYGNDFENVSFLVAQNGQIIYEKYNGYADKENNILNSAETPLHIASVSKVLTAAAVLKLVEAGKIELDQKLTTIFKGFPYPEVTIRTLLNHRSGIKKYGYFTEDNKVWDKSKTLTNKDILNLLITQKFPLDHPTDTHFVYNNTNYVLLALVIEKITGMKYGKAMKLIVFDPLGMKNTFVLTKPHRKVKLHHRTNGTTKNILLTIWMPCMEIKTSTLLHVIY